MTRTDRLEPDIRRGAQPCALIRPSRDDTLSFAREIFGRPRVTASRCLVRSLARSLAVASSGLTYKGSSRASSNFVPSSAFSVT